MELTTADGYRDLLERISQTYTQGRVGAMQAVNAHLLETYWQVGRYIVEFEQEGKARADYGKTLIVNLARDLTLRHGKEFSRSNLIYMRLFYLCYPISQKPSHQLRPAYPKSATLSHLLSWSHVVLIAQEAGQ